MKASLKWLKEFVDFSLGPEEVSGVLTMAGLEVENIEGKEDDSILEINVTPNRPDCLSIRGLARELSVILNRPLKDIPVVITEEEGVRPLIEIKDPDLCSRYSSRIIRGVRVGPSPEWISGRLESHGIRAINNIVDITNYVLIETGHPLHAFDLDELDGSRIVVRTAGDVKTFKTLDGMNRDLSPDMLMIWDAKRPVAIAGVMGGLDTEVNESTFDILLESAYFDPRSVRRTSKALNLVTEASYRFERGADIKITVQALDRAVRLIAEIAGGKTTKVTDVYTTPFTQKTIFVRLNRINDIIGTEVNPSLVQKMLSGLGMKNEIQESYKITAGLEGKGIVVAPPSFRQDIQMEIDVIEEIARHYGYDKIPALLPCVTMRPVVENTVWKLTKTIKDSMRKSGYSEAINYSFLNPLSLDKLKLPAADRRRNFIRIRNPLKKEDDSLRTTLIPALLENVKLNINRGEKSLRLFEVSSVFIDSGQKLPDEIKKIAAVYLKDEMLSLWQRKHDGFYDIKGTVENLLLELGIKRCAFIQEPDACEPYLHPGKSCVIKLDGQAIGTIGALHPEVAQSFDIQLETYLLELDMDNVFSSTPSKTVYSPLPKYPYVERDLAVVVSDDVTASSAEEIIWDIDSGMIESVTLFDVYTGKPVPDGQKSLAFSIRYRAADRTLTAEEVNELQSKVLKKLEDSLKAELRR